MGWYCVLQVAIELFDVIFLIEHGRHVPGGAVNRKRLSIFVLGTCPRTGSQIQGEIDDSLLRVQVFLFKAQIAIDDIQSNQNAHDDDDLNENSKQNITNGSIPIRVSVQTYFFAHHERVRLVVLGQRFVFSLDERLQVVGEFLLHECDAQPCSGSSHVRSHRWQISDAGRDVLCLETVLFDTLQNVPQLFLRSEQTLLRLQTVTQHMLQHDEKVLQWNVIRIEHATETQRLFQQFFHHQFAYIH